MIDILTGTAFDTPKRMHHREDEVALESGVGSRSRGLLALSGIMYGGGNSEEEMYKELFRAMVMGWYQNRGGEAIKNIVPELVDDTITTVRAYAFQHCGLGSITLPNCTTLEGSAFYGAWSGSASSGNDDIIIRLPKVINILGTFPVQGLPGGCEVHFDSLTSIAQNTFTGSSYYIKWFFPSVTSITATNWNYASSWSELHLDSMTCDQVMSTPGWPWGGMTTKYFGYGPGVCYCSDGYIAYENGAWTKHPN